MNVLTKPLVVVAALAALAAPMGALAQGNGNANGKGHGSDKHGKQKPAHAQVERHARPATPATGHCPPGLAKKNPPCVPPGQAKKQVVTVGDHLDRDLIHLISRPGVYGLAPAPRGSRYAVVGNQLVRIDSDSYRVLSVLRTIDRILD